jgi:hypothetical protein
LALSESGSLRSGRDADSVLYAGELRQLWQKQMAMPAKP